MNTSIRIVTAFAIGSVAGALLGLLLYSRPDSANKAGAATSGSGQARSHNKFFKTNENFEKHTGGEAEEADEEFEEA